MRILVTGARGKVGAAAVHALLEAGHDVTGCDLAPPVYEGGERRGRHFPAPPTPAGHALRAAPPAAGAAFAAVRGHAAVIHAAALPEPTQNPPHTVFHNNVMATFNVAEACVRLGAARIVNVSSETITGFGFAERPFFSPYAPIDEALPNRPQDPYALAKLVGEQIMDATVARSDVRAVSIRPTWVQWEGNYERSLGPWLRAPGPSESFWSYIGDDD